MGKTEAIQCTLSEGQRLARGLTWRDVVRRFVTIVSERPGGYVLTLNADASASMRIKKLVESERRCCAWMHLTIQDGPPATLSITAASMEGKAVIAEMLGFDELLSES